MPSKEKEGFFVAQCFGLISQCAAVQNEVHVLYHCQDVMVCSLRKKFSFVLFRFSQFFFFTMETPYINFWLAKTSNKPTSLTTRLAVNPTL